VRKAAATLTAIRRSRPAGRFEQGCGKVVGQLEERLPAPLGPRHTSIGGRSCSTHHRPSIGATTSMRRIGWRHRSAVRTIEVFWRSDIGNETSRPRCSIGSYGSFAWAPPGRRRLRRCVSTLSFLCPRSRASARPSRHNGSAQAIGRRGSLLWTAAGWRWVVGPGPTGITWRGAGPSSATCPRLGWRARSRRPGQTPAGCRAGGPGCRPAR
jgi:hypothetical protein